MISRYQTETEFRNSVSSSLRTKAGAVVIGRNEGERLEQCLATLTLSLDNVVYVDSGSTDGSCELAKELGVEVVNLNTQIPFTAARARNEGIRHLLDVHPGVEFVQVVDGDCAVAGGWLEAAMIRICDRKDVAVVCGQRRERFPKATIYNQLCDQEWRGDPGEIESCGGDALIRVSAFQEAGGYNPALIAGEEPEMCVRLRKGGWKILRMSDDMTWHDADMQSISQWWNRARRAGHAYAECHAIHGSTTGFRRREVISIVIWGGVVPFVAVAMAWPTYGLSLMTACVLYFALTQRIRLHRLSVGDPADQATLYARFTVAGKLAQFVGVIQYYYNRIFDRTTRIIEYK